jgi:calcineurin-like phosphoesterase family protein
MSAAYATPEQTLRSLYMQHLESVLPGSKRGAVAGKGTRRGMRRAATWSQLSAPAWQEFRQAWNDTPERIWIWSDHHLGHANIIKYTDRPFGNAQLMDQALLEAAWTVPADDWLVFVGDLAMWMDPEAVHAWVSACPGRKVMVIGNHDCRGKGHPDSIEEWQTLGFEAVADCLALPRQGSGHLWLTHYPLPASAMPLRTLNLHGHTHTHSLDGPFVNVCVEQLGFTPRKLIDLI